MLAVLLALITPSPGVGVRELVEMTSISSLAASPDGRWVAFRLEEPSIERDAVALRWAVAPADRQGAVRIIASGGTALASGPGVILDEPPLWLPDSTGFLFRAHVGGETQVWRVQIASGAVTRITDDPGEVSAFTLSADGQLIRYEAGPARRDVLAADQRNRDRGVLLTARVDLSVGAVGGFDRGAGAESVRMSGDWFDRAPLLTDVRALEQRLDGGAPHLVPPKPAVRPEAANTAIAVAACRELNCKSDRITATVPVPGYAGYLLTTTRSDRTQTLHILEGGHLRTLAGGVGLLAGGRSAATPCAVNNHSAFCVAAEAASPPRLVRIDLRDGSQRELYAPNAGLGARLTARAEPLIWQDGAGRAFTGVLVLPPDAEASRRPLVVQYYLCDGFLRGGVGDELPYYALAARGIASLCINRYVGRERGFNRIDEYQVALGGVRAIVDRLARAGVVDPERIGMHGLSFGSEVAMWVARRSRLLRAVSIATGQIEPSLYWFEGFPGRDTPSVLKTYWGLGAPGTAAWRDLSPAADAEAPSVPLLMQLPESEARWSIERITRLARAGKPVETFVFPDAGHIKFLPRQQEAANQRNLDWFTYWLLGKTAHALIEPQGLERWVRLAGKFMPVR